ncbi:MAG: winged helix-turn-helix domain-containing protein [Actinomycetota bacterium]
MTAPLELSNEQARRVAIRGQRLTLPRPRSILDVVRGLFFVQIDPTSSVARTEHLVLWSRLGHRYRVADLERLLWQDKELFEFNAYIVPASDYPLHRPSMRGYLRGERGRERYVASWLEANASFRRHILKRLRDDGPLRTRDIENRAVEGWRTGGWNDESNDTAMMLEVLWRRGEVMIVGREGQQRIWDLAERRLPVHQRRPAAEIARDFLERRLRATGIAQPRTFAQFGGHRPAGWERALARLEREGIAVPVRVEGLRGTWLAHGELLEGRFRGRAALLSPFDQLIHDRARTEALFGFRYRLEIYVPKDEREYGYFVLPILFGERLVGRLDPAFDRSARVLRVRRVWAEAGAPAEAGEAIAGELSSLGRWLGASRIEVGDVPTTWRRTLRAL